MTESSLLPGVNVLWGTDDGGRLSLFESDGKKSPVQAAWTSLRRGVDWADSQGGA